MSERQRKGKRFEAKVQEELARRLAGFGGGRLYTDQWIRFFDANGPGWAQPDAFIVQRKDLWVFECKLTFVDTAVEQIRDRYAPLLTELFPGLHPWLVVVCHDLSGPRGGRVPPFIRDLDEIFDAPAAPWYLWHWRPKL